MRRVSALLESEGICSFQRRNFADRSSDSEASRNMIRQILSFCASSIWWGRSVSNDMAANISGAFIDQSRKLLTDSYLPRIERAVEPLSIENLGWRANPESNSIGNLILHMNGNVRQ